MFLGGGWGWKFLFTKIFFCKKNVPWVLKRKINKKIGGGGDFGVFGAPHAPPVGRTGSENDTLLPMTMTRDRQKFWNLAVKSYHPETLAAGKNKKQEKQKNK